MSPETTTTKLCPTCGTRLSENATRCLVCGTELTPAAEAKKQKAAVQGSRMPEITLTLPAVMGLLALFLIVGAVLLFFALRTGIGGQQIVQAEVSSTPTDTPTPSATPTETLVPTDAPTATALPPLEYTVAANDNCGSIAYFFHVSVSSIIILNNLPTACNTLVIGQKIMVPQPTPTITAAPSASALPDAATRQACDKVAYTVQANDTLSTIAANYAVPQDAIKEFNGLPTDTVYLGMNLVIPLCRRAATPGPTPTPTTPPPYPAPNLLLPADGNPFTLADDTVTLQWASIGTLRDNERYQVVVEDVTQEQGRKDIEYVTDTKYIVPSSFRPSDSASHIFRWWVTTVRQTGTNEQGQPIYSSAGAQSIQRVFSWQGVAPQGTPSP